MDTTKIEQFINKAAETGTFILDKLPDYLQQYLHYAVFDAVSGIILGFILLLIPFVIRIFVKSTRNIYDTWWLGKRVEDGCDIGLWTVTIICWIGGLVFTIGNIYRLIEVLYFPQVYLIKEFIK